MMYLGSEPFKKYYYANKCSCAALFWLLLTIFFVIVPIFLGLATNNFWPEQEEYVDQPTILYRDQAILINSQSSGILGYSPISAVDDLFGNKVSNPSISGSSIDKDNDGKPEMFEFKISFSDTPTLVSQVYLFFDIGFSNKVRLQMQDFLVFTVSSSSGITNAVLEGQIQFNQANPLQSSTVTRNVYNTSVFDEPLENLDAISLVERKMRRNETITCKYTSVVNSGTSSGAKEITIRLDVPTQVILWYIPTLFQNLKFAWIQYIYLFIPIYWILQWIMRFAFRNKIFAIHELRDLKKVKAE